MAPDTIDIKVRTCSPLDSDNEENELILKSIDVWSAIEFLSCGRRIGLTIRNKKNGVKLTVECFWRDLERAKKVLNYR